MSPAAVPAQMAALMVAEGSPVRKKPSASDAAGLGLGIESQNATASPPGPSLTVHRRISISGVAIFSVSGGDLVH